MMEGRKENVQRENDGYLKGRTAVRCMKIRNYRMIPPKKLACAKAGLRRECGLLGLPLKSMRLGSR